MLVWLLRELSFFGERAEQFADQYSTGNSRVYLTARIALAGVSSFLVAIWLGPVWIGWLKRHFRERIASASPQLDRLQAAKASTPTMGGLFIVAAVVISSLIWADLANSYVQIAIATALAFGLLGAVDDWVKLRTSRKGLTARQKLAVQLVLSAGLGCWLWSTQAATTLGPALVWPFGNVIFWLGLGLIPWAMLVISGSSNAVNLTDGLDGLAAGCGLFATCAFAVLAYLSGHALIADYLQIPRVIGGGELAVVLGSLGGALLGFLWFNCHPAMVFMGDTGALPIGALLAVTALVIHQEVLLLIIGGVFVVETGSVFLQISIYRATGRKPLLCSPLHNHYLFAGMPETRIVTRFWIVSALLAIAGLASLKIN